MKQTWHGHSAFCIEAGEAKMMKAIVVTDQAAGTAGMKLLFELRATFPLDAPRRLWAFASCPSRVKRMTQVMRKLALIMFSMASAGVYVPASLPSPALAFANDSSGPAVFKGHCTPCHGEDGKGKAYIGTPDFTNPKVQASLTDSEILDIITNGKKGTIMPAWKGNLSAQEISAAASYVRSLGGGH